MMGKKILIFFYIYLFLNKKGTKIFLLSSCFLPFVSPPKMDENENTKDKNKNSKLEIYLLAYRVLRVQILQLTKQN